MFVLFGWFLNVLFNNKAILRTGPKTEGLTIFRAATHETELGDHDFCLSRSHYTDTDPTSRELAAIAGIEPETSSPGVVRSTDWATAPPLFVVFLHIINWNPYQLGWNKAVFRDRWPVFTWILLFFLLLKGHEIAFSGWKNIALSSASGVFFFFPCAHPWVSQGCIASDINHVLHYEYAQSWVVKVLAWSKIVDDKSQGYSYVQPFSYSIDHDSEGNWMYTTYSFDTPADWSATVLIIFLVPWATPARKREWAELDRRANNGEWWRQSYSPAFQQAESWRVWAPTQVASEAALGSGLCQAGYVIHVIHKSAGLELCEKFN